MFRAVVLSALLATVARAEPGAEAGEPEAPAAAVEPAPKPARVAPPEALEALDREAKPLTGLARAERLLAFVAAYPDDEHVPPFELEIGALIAAAKAQEGKEPLLEALNSALKDLGPARRLKLEYLTRDRDRRALPVLAYVARRDPDVETRAAAARLLGRFGPGDAEVYAQALALDANEPLPVRTAAIDAFATLGTTTAGDRLAALVRDDDQPEEVRQAALDGLRKHFPALAATVDVGPRVATSSGRALGTVTGALSLGYTLGLVGNLSSSPTVGTTVGAMGGLVIGGAAAHLLSRGTDLSQGDSAWMLSAAAWSVPVGVFASEVFGGPTTGCSGNACPAVMLGTHVAAMTGAWLTRKPLHLEPVDAFEVNIGTFAALGLTIGLLDLPTPSGDVRPAFALLALAPVAGFATSAYFADRLRLTFPLTGLIVAAAAEGAFMGNGFGEAFVPSTLPGGPLGADVPNLRRSDQITGLTWLGVGLGMGGTLAASAFWQPTGSDALLTTLGALDGNLVGAGLPFLFGGTGDGKLFGGAAFGGLAGIGATLALRGPLDLKLERGDAVITLAGHAFGTFQGIGWGMLLGRTGVLGNDPSLGFALVASGVLGAASTALTQKLDLGAWHAGWLFSGAVWGGWLAFWTSYALDLPRDPFLASVLVASDVGLAAAAILTSPLVGLDPTSLAIISLGGVAGTTLFTMVATFVAIESSGHPVALANVAGTAVGLVAGGAVAAFVGGSGGDVGAPNTPEFLGNLPLPAASVGPMFDPNGRVTDGATATLVWPL